ncbi:MAG: YdcF family protein [Desulfovibrio sp.]
MKRTLALLFQAVGAATLLGALAFGVLMAFAGQWLQVDDGPARSDYILPLAGDGNRVVHAAALYHQGWAPKILVSLAYEDPPTPLDELKARMGYPRFASCREWDEAAYAVLDVPQATLEFFGNGHISTVEEAEALRAHLQAAPVRLLLVTSPYHARRAKTIFEHVYPEATIRMVIAPGERFRERWWADQQSAQMVVLETAKTIHYLLGGVYRSTDPTP